jgi:two-component system LytT family response regulator
MKTIRTLIVDDEELARRGLEIRLEKFPDVSIVGQSRNGREALAAVTETAPDLMFLDVQMPGMDGFEVLKRMSGRSMPVVIFVTAFDEYAIRAFDANALDYLLKPINDERLAEAVQRARVALEERRADSHRQKLLKLVCELTGQELTLDMALSEADGEQPRFPRRRGTMKRLEELLDPRMFVRIHRSAIVNRHRVSSLRPHRNGEYFLQLDCNHELKLSRKYKSALSRFADNL